MAGFVLDASLTLAFCLAEEETAFSNRVLELLDSSHAVVPHLSAYEVPNALAVAERRRRILFEQRDWFLSRLQSLPVEIEHRPALWVWQKVIPLAHRYNLTAYDAAYLDLAIRENLPLATLDLALQKAARSAGVSLIEES